MSHVGQFGALNGDEDDFVAGGVEPSDISLDITEDFDSDGDDSYDSTSQTSSMFSQVPEGCTSRVKRQFALSLMLLIVGVGCLITAIVHLARGQEVWLFFLGGSFTTIPGAYWTHHIFRAYRGTPGYTFDALPSSH
jgi:hypothetical protein